VSEELKKAITLCADDFGISPAVSDGIVKLVKAKRLSAVGVMTLINNWPEEAQKLTFAKNRIDIGLHFTMTDFKALSYLPKTAPQEYLPALPQLFFSAIFGKLNLDEIRDELTLQLNAFESAMGMKPDFIDGHQHIHQFPGIVDVLMDVIRHRYTSPLPYIRSAGSPVSQIWQRQVSIVRALFIGWLGNTVRGKAAKNGIPTNNDFTGIYSFHGDYRQAFNQFLVSASNGLLIMCHPGEVDAQLRALDPLTDQRQVELNYFLSDDFIDDLKINGVELSRFTAAAG
jgi:predicted glycoside hydrolase/deacetylase ChbG (UPF0249 family)